VICDSSGAGLCKTSLDQHVTRCGEHAIAGRLAADRAPVRRLIEIVELGS
jgi:hypothetical protein